MILAIIALVIVLLCALLFILLRKAGGGRFPWVQFYLKGRESDFVLKEINLLRRIAVDARLDNPTALFWSIKQLDRSIKGIIVKYRSRSQESDPEYNNLLSKLFELRKRVEFDQPKYKLGIKSSRKLSMKQVLKITLPGSGPYTSFIVENLPRYMAVSHPEGPKLPDGFSWKNQKVGIYCWRAEDAGYFFQTKVLEDYLERKYPILHILHSDNLVRTQKRHSVRVETDLAAEVFPLQSIGMANETAEQSRGIKCRIIDLSEGGLAVLIGGQAKVGLPIKVQFTIGDSLIVMCGTAKGVHFDQPKNRSTLHVQASPLSVIPRNRVLTYVYNLFGERGMTGLPKRPDAVAAQKSVGATAPGPDARAASAFDAEQHPTVSAGLKPVPGEGATIDLK